MSLSLASLVFSLYKPTTFNPAHDSILLTKPSKCLKVRASSSAAPGIDLTTLESAVAKKDSDAVKEALDQLNEVGWAKKWSSNHTSHAVRDAGSFSLYRGRHNRIFGCSCRPASWGLGLFCAYLIGSISLIVLAVGSIRQVAYLLGLPILGYSLDIGKEHVNLIDERLEKLIYSGQLDAKELDRLAVVAMAGLAAEGLQYDKVVGQSADLFTLQRFINRSKPQLSKDQQQNLTRWAVLFAASLIKTIGYSMKP
ncbi:UNVERIFIED_CONTAM: hypothetical protein Sangu_2575400 [Sesamum angustifolium]|uniref:Uncharacterized protein n=1 Tax=Sesamum angustifolium TaxID=2727405 RepID=A0AAW2J7E8_9LAMI